MINDGLYYLTVRNVADQLRISTWTVRAMIKDGRLKAFRTKSGHKSPWRIDTAELARLAKESK